MKYALIWTVLALTLTACTARTTLPENVTPVSESSIQSPQLPAQENSVITSTEKKVTQETPVPSADTSIKKNYSIEEVSVHNGANSCWLILDNKVYDVTSYVGKHPGGDTILKGCGKDATQMFSRHPESAKAMKEKFYIGDLKQ